MAKYENTILYLCSKAGGSIAGKKKLAKLLYYVDFDRYEYDESMQSVTGDTYKHWKMGPVPESYVSVIRSLDDKGKLKHEAIEASPDHQYPTEIFTCLAQPDIDVFDESDIKIMDRVIRKYGGLTGKELEILTHQEAPYVATEPDEEISYDLAFYRETDFSDVVAVA